MMNMPQQPSDARTIDAPVFVAQPGRVDAPTSGAFPPPVLQRPARPARPAKPARPPRPALVRARSCLATGTAEGLARHLGWPLVLVRAGFVVCTPLAGAGALFYLWLWAFMPFADAEGEASTRAVTRRAPIAWILLVLAVAALLVVVWSTNDAFLRGTGALAAGSFAVAAGLWASFVDRNDPGRGVRHSLIIRVGATVVLSVLVLMQLSVLGAYGGNALLTFVSAVAALVGIVLVWSSRLVSRWRELQSERVQRIREEQRSEMAAHLHDSVLQTLALIQNRAGASTEVSRLARAQERELRSWLFDGDTPADSDLPTDLRDFAGALELDYPVQIDVVSAGLSNERASGEVAAAAREAMLNAARHAGGEVSVYIEGGTASVEVFVRDRGPGFDPALVPADRLGVRESIIGRMRRAGGTATVRAGGGGHGTEVHLHLAEGDSKRG